jgi:hypothetical protein
VGEPGDDCPLVVWASRDAQWKAAKNREAHTMQNETMRPSRQFELKDGCRLIAATAKLF